MTVSIRDFSDITKIGTGRMGNVYLATQPARGRKVVIKQIPSLTLADQKSVERFENEIRKTAGLNHDNIIRIFDVGQDKQTFFIVREYVDGPNLKQVMHWHPFSREIGLMILLQAIKGLNYAHQHGIVHLDFKPGNILIAKSGKTKVVDFGISHALESEVNDPSHGFISPKYMAPEVASGSRVRGNFTDIWAVGILAYRLISGSVPFVEDDIRKLVHEIVHEKEKNLLTLVPTLPGNLAGEVSACLEKNPQNRPRSLDKMIACLEDYFYDLDVHDCEETAANYIQDRNAEGQALARMLSRYHQKKGKQYLDAGNRAMAAAHVTEAEKFSALDKDLNAFKIAKGPIRVRTSGLYPKRIESKPALPRLEIPKIPGPGSFAEWKNSKKIISIAGIIGIVLIVAVCVIMMTGKNHSTHPTAEPQPLKGAIQEASGQKHIKSASSAAVPESGLVPVSSTANQKSAFADKSIDPSMHPELPKNLMPHQKDIRKSNPRAGQPKYGKPNARQAVSISLKPSAETAGTGLLHIHTYPWAEMYVDNVFQGTTPTPNPILLAAGDHSLVLKHDGYVTYSGTVHIDKGDTTRISIQLQQ
jgi:serine/threonine protein kinase